MYSSWVSADVRIIWNFDENNQLTILVLGTGKHLGADQVHT